MKNAKARNIRPINKGSRQGLAIPVCGGIAKTANNYDINKRYPTSILKCSSKQAECNSLNIIHPTQKPVALFEYLIKTYTHENDMILDNCLGSGTTSVAAENTGRNSIGIDIALEWCEKSYARLKDVTRQLRMDREPSVIEKVGF